MSFELSSVQAHTRAHGSKRERFPLRHGTLGSYGRDVSRTRTRSCRNTPLASQPDWHDRNALHELFWASREKYLGVAFRIIAQQARLRRRRSRCLPFRPSVLSRFSRASSTWDLVDTDCDERGLDASTQAGNAPSRFGPGDWFQLPPKDGGDRYPRTGPRVSLRQPRSSENHLGLAQPNAAAAPPGIHNDLH